MDYGYLLRRSWNIMWSDKWLIALSLITILISVLGNVGGFLILEDDIRDDMTAYTSAPDDDNDAEFADLMETFLPIGLIYLIARTAAALIGPITRGAVINGVKTIEEGGTSSFSAAWRIGAQKGWRMIGINVASIILQIAPLICLLLIIIPPISTQLATGEARAVVNGVTAFVCILGCCAVPLHYMVGMLQSLAEQSAMQKDTGVFASFKQAWNVFRGQAGSVLVILVIQSVANFALNRVISTAMLIGIIRIFLYIVWVPLYTAITAISTTYFLTMWTLAWRQWASPQADAALIPSN